MKKYLLWVFLALLFLTPLVDMINSEALRANILLGNLGQIYKGIIILLALVLLEKKQRTYYLVALGLGGALSVIHYIVSIGSTTTTFVNDILFVIKVTYIIPLMALLPKASPKYIFGASAFAWLVIVENILLGVFGQGYAQYALGYGYKGFFYSGNEMALTLIVTSAVLLYILYSQKLTLLAFVISIFLPFLGPLQGMKSLMLGLPLIVVAVPLITYRKLLLRRFQNISTTKKLGIGAFLIFAGISAVAILYTISPQFFIRIKEITERSGIVAAVLSERDKYLKAGLTMYKKDFTVAEKIFGKGVLPAQTGMIPYLHRPKVIEMDPFDLLFEFGIAVFIYYGVWVSWIAKIRVKKSKTLFVAFLNVLLFGLSIITGHVVYSTLLVTYWAMANTLMQPKKAKRIYFLGSTETGGIATYMLDTKKYAKKLSIVILPTHVDGGILRTIFAFKTSYLKLCYFLLRDFIQGNYSIIHLHMATGGSFVRKIFVLLTLSWFADKTILHLHSGASVVFFDKIMKLPFGKGLLSAIFTLPDAVVVVSKNLYTDLMSSFENNRLMVVKNNWQILPNAIQIPSELPEIKPFSGKGTLKIVTVSRLNKVKNLSLIPKIASILKQQHEKFSIEIAGEGPDKPAIQEAILEYDVSDCVKLLGQISHNEINKIYHGAHVFLLPSNYESFGIVVLEAYVNGLLAITSNVGGLNDIVIDEKTGYRCPPADAQEFADTIQKLLLDSEKMNVMRKQAQQFATEFSYEKHLKKLKALYNKSH